MSFSRKNPGPASAASRCVRLALLAACLPAGCATYDRTARDVNRAIEEWQWHRAPVDQVARPPSDRADAPQPLQGATAGRPVDHYIRTALERHPGIQAAMAQARAKLERIPQVTSLPDPMLRAIVRPEPVQTAAGNMYFTLGVSQTFPMLARLERAGNAAAAEARMAIEQLNTRRVQLIADVERAYWQVFLFDRYLEITGENRRLLEDLVRVVHTQYEVGRVPQQDLLRVQTELAKLRDDEHRHALRRAAAAAMLNQLMDYPPQREIAGTSAPDLPAIAVEAEDLVTLADQHNPELAALRERLARDRELIELANLGYWPDLTLGAEWNYLRGREPFIPPINSSTGQRPPYSRMSEYGDDNWGITLQMNIPVWVHAIEAEKREARLKLLATQSELHSTGNLISFRIFDAWSRIEAQQHTLHVLDSELIPQARQTYEVTLTSYQAGRSDFLTLIDNWRRWLDFELMRHRETVDLETALADLQREVGLQLISATTTEEHQTRGEQQDDS